jgi:hypothetical protein
MKKVDEANAMFESSSSEGPTKTTDWQSSVISTSPCDFSCPDLPCFNKLKGGHNFRLEFDERSDDDRATTRRKRIDVLNDSSASVELLKASRAAGGVNKFPKRVENIVFSNAMDRKPLP